MFLNLGDVKQEPMMEYKLLKVVGGLGQYLYISSKLVCT